MGEVHLTNACPQCAELNHRIALLEEQLRKLTAALEESRRAGKRQAAPFRKKQLPTKPKKPGRKAGEQHGQHHRRAAPRADQIDEIYDAPLPHTCPHCDSSQLQQTHGAVQYQTEIPRRPIIRRFNIQIGRCTDCGRRVQGRHALQTSDALGAAASQLGADAHAAIALLNKESGLSHGKCAKLFKSLFGIAIARSTSARSMLRTARRCAQAYRDIRQSVRSSPWVVCDETGWRKGGKNAWLHVLVGHQATYYTIDESRSWEPAKRVLGGDYAGVLIHDGWAAYDRFRKARHQQCLAHLIRRCKEMLLTATRGAVRFPRAVLSLVEQALALRREHRSAALSDDALASAGLQLACRLEELCDGRFSNPLNRRLAKHLSEHIWSWFWFLLEPEIDATNWRAEQAIRPAVVNRKVWGGNRTADGAAAQSVLMSVLQTLRQQNRDVLPFIHQTLCNTRPQPLLLSSGR